MPWQLLTTGSHALPLNTAANDCLKPQVVSRQTEHASGNSQQHSEEQLEK